MYYFFFVLFLLLFIPIVNQEYNRDLGYNRSAKSFNLIVSLLLLFLFSNNTKGELILALDETPNIAEKVFVECGILSPSINGLSWVFYFILSFVLSVLIIQIALRKEKSRRIFLQVFPFYCVLESINIYRHIIPKNDVVSNSDYLIPFILSIYGFIVILITIFYTRSFIKKFFQFGKSDDIPKFRKDIDQTSEIQG